MSLPLYAVVFMTILWVTGCAPRRPLVKLPTAEQAENIRLRQENESLKAQLGELTRNCSAVLRIFKEADLNARKPAAKEK